MKNYNLDFNKRFDKLSGGGGGGNGGDIFIPSGIGYTNLSTASFRFKKCVLSIDKTNDDKIVVSFGDNHDEVELNIENPEECGRQIISLIAKRLLKE